MGVLPADKFAKLKAAQEGFYLVGLQDVTGSTGIRRDIDDLIVNEKEAFNVFVIALANMQVLSPENTQNPMSYFQIAGIHGLPLRPWNKEGVKLNTSGNQSGYCHHSHIGFGPWHRPYLALLEQSIFYNMIQVVEKDFQDETYYAAVRRWRLPFWDYFRPRGGSVTWRAVGPNDTTNSDYDCGIPDVFTFPSLMIRTSLNGNLAPYPNPLQKFKFPAEKDGGLDRNDWNTEPGYDKTQTTRYPGIMKERTLSEAYNHLVTRSKRTPISLDTSQAQDLALNKFREQALKHLTVMFRDNSYVQMSVFGSNSKVTGAHGSLEGTIHGTYHGLIGDSGHMGDVPVAAFDPVFWFHHAQIDRLFAIWQKINPNSWFPTDPATIQSLGSTYFDPEENLMPFRSAKSGQASALGKNGWWTCNTSKSLNVFGYTYADVDAANAQQNFNNKYGWSIRWNRGDAFGKCPTDMLPYDLTKAQIFQFSQSDLNRAKPGIVKSAVHAAQSIMPAGVLAGASLSQPAAEPVAEPAALAPQAVMKTDATPAERTIKSHSADGTHAVLDADIDESKVSRSWYIDMEAERLALNGSFFINYFTGPFGSDPRTYNTEKELAGTTNVFAAPIQACDNCGRDLTQAILVADTTDITPILLDYINVNQLPSLSASDVIPFLKGRLKWRVVTAKNQLIDPRTVASLKLGVSSRIAPLPPNTGEVRYQEFPTVIEQIIANAS